MRSAQHLHPKVSRVRVLDLFSGIGGFSLGLERAGMRTVAFCEVDPYCRAVLRRHWPTVPCFTDITRLDADVIRAAELGSIDVICGGFPCQDISVAGKGHPKPEHRTHCIHGHPFDAENTYRTPDGRRQCRACHHAIVRRFKPKPPKTTANDAAAKP